MSFGAGYAETPHAKSRFRENAAGLDAARSLTVSRLQITGTVVPPYVDSIHNPIHKMRGLTCRGRDLAQLKWRESVV